MSPTEALARIAALCEQSPAQLDVDRAAIVAVLAEVTPETGLTLTDAEARIAARWYEHAEGWGLTAADLTLAERLGARL